VLLAPSSLVSRLFSKPFSYASALEREHHVKSRQN